MCLWQDARRRYGATDLQDEVLYEAMLPVGLVTLNEESWQKQVRNLLGTCCLLVGT